MKRKNQKFISLVVVVILFFLPAISLLAVHTILLKQGKTIKGTVSSQNLDHVEIESKEGKHLVIPKKSVLKIIYRDLAEEEEVSIRKQEEAKRESEKLKLIEQKKQEILTNQEIGKDATALKQNSESANTVNSTLRDSFVLGSPNYTQTITLASFGQKCKVHSEYPEYFWMFGAFRFKEPDLIELLPKENVPLRISQRSTYADIAFTMLGGFLVTVTRKTLIIESCEGEGYRLISEKELNQIKNSAVSDIKTQQEIESLQEKVELELLEKDLQDFEKSKKGKK
jgi:hypothetical protein